MVNVPVASVVATPPLESVVVERIPSQSTAPEMKNEMSPWAIIPVLVFG